MAQKVEHKSREPIPLITEEFFPIWSEENERAVLGVIYMQGNSALTRLDLDPKEFWLFKHQKQYEMYLEMNRLGIPIDSTSVRTFIEEHRIVDETGGIGYIAIDCADSVGSTGSLSYYANQVRKSAIKREEQKLLREALEKVKNGIEPGDLANQLIKQLTEISNRAERFRSQRFVRPAYWKRLDVSEVQSWEVEEFKITVEGLLAQGNFVLLAAESQTGKTLFALYFILMLVLGGKLFDRFNITPVKKVLYLILEDPKRRVKSRILDYCLSLPDPDKFIIQWLPGFNLLNDEMFAELKQMIEEEGADIVVIDTYQRATIGTSSFLDEVQGPILAKLADLTRTLQTTIISVDHFSKQDRKNRTASINDVKGTGGKAQNADCVILLQKDHNRNQLKFFSHSKDFGDQAFILEVSPENSGLPKYTFVSELAGETRKKRADDRQTQILEIVRKNQSVNSSFISTTLKISPATAMRDLKILVDKGFLDSEGEGRWTKYFINQSQELMI